MKAGISTLYLTVEPFKGVLRAVREYSLTCRGWEVVDENQLRLNEWRVRRLNDLRKSLNLEYTVHAPFCDVNIASLNPPAKKLSMKIVEASLSKAALLEAKMFVFHPGFHSPCSHFYPNFPKSVNIESVGWLLKRAENLGVPVSVENMPRGIGSILSTVDDFDEFYTHVEVEGIGLALDVGHANTFGQVQAFLERFKRRITHVHIHDNDGSFDTHNALGDGNINWVGVVKALQTNGYSNLVIVESTQKPYESFRNLTAAIKP